MGDRWGPEGPPEEAYSRVTDPERFAPLHDDARALIDELEAEFDVERVSVEEPVDRLSLASGARPTVMLRPLDPAAAPLFVTFTEFPGVLVRFGFHHSRAFPTCGCDACDESAEQESALMRDEVRRMIASRYSERLELPLIGAAHVGGRFESDTGSSFSRSKLDREQARALKAAGRTSRDWVPWPKRAAPESA